VPILSIFSLKRKADTALPAASAKSAHVKNAAVKQPEQVEAKEEIVATVSSEPSTNNSATEPESLSSESDGKKFYALRMHLSCIKQAQNHVSCIFICNFSKNATLGCTN
jgi:hypothetical protein